MRKHGKFKFIALTTDPKSGPLSCAMLWNFGGQQIAHRRRRRSAWDVFGDLAPELSIHCLSILINVTYILTFTREAQYYISIQ